jgi:cytosine/adenosine deaminase-related metal-dependent hydrolase
MTLGITAGGAGTVADPLPPANLEAARSEFALARQLGVPISSHLSARENTPPGWVEASYQAGFLGKDVLLIHVLSASPAEMKMIAAAGSPVSASPARSCALVMV